MSTAAPHIYGIRHHGPGSARSLLLALERQQPDLILIEGPPDGDALLRLAAHPDMAPPVALLVYNPKDLRQASFFPFAEYSPEWQAILFALQRQRPVQCMDLPMSLAFALQENESAFQQPELALTGPAGDMPARTDPFAEIARLAGYTDPERWWEATFERLPADAAGQADVFALVLELMTALREDKWRQGMAESPETLLREAFMRQTIRAAQKDGYHNIAVVCGAWHAPALHDLHTKKASADAAVLKGLKKVKTQATWIPWSFDRLAAQSGYGAGVIAPAWYRVLWHSEHGAALAPHTEWLAQAARLLREHDIILSSAHVIEAVRLAETLATLRHTLLPGIEELREAVVTVMCQGSDKAYEIVEQQLVTGDVLGAVPDIAPAVPLKADFEAQVRSARLWPLSTEARRLELDLREAAQGQKSRLLHRLLLLQIPWGKLLEITGRREGRFHEPWEIRWQPDYEIRLIEAGTWGNTVEKAASGKARFRLRQSEQLPELVQLLDTILKAEIPAVLPPLLQKLREISALAQDALALADTLLPLVEVLRYGHARQLNLATVEQLLEQLAPRVCIQLPGACQGVQEEVAADILKKVLAVHRALDIWQRQEFIQAWYQALLQIAGQAPPLLAGISSRLLFEQQVHSAAETATEMRFRLSAATPAVEAAQWLEGFLHGSGLLLIHQPALWNILDQWVQELPEAVFPELLPLLRRTFSHFAGPERERMLDMAKSHVQPVASTAGADTEWDAELAAELWPLMQLILGNN